VAEDPEMDEEHPTQRIPSNEGNEEHEDGIEVEDESEDETEDEREQPQGPKSSSPEPHGASCLENASPAVSGHAASLQITHKKNPGPNGQPLEHTGMNSKPRRAPEGDVSERSTESDTRFAAPHSSSEGKVTRLELERQLSVLLSAQTERDQRFARLTDVLALKSALLDQAEANAADRLLMQTSLVEQRDAELVDMQSKLRNTEA
jgi:hypothetical protein